MKKLVTSAVLLISLFAFTAMAAAKTVYVGPTKPYKTISAAINSPNVKSGDVIQVSAGSYAGASFSKVDKKLTIKGTVVAGLKKTIITGGVGLYGAKGGFYFSGKSAGTTIQDLIFKVQFPVYSVRSTGGIRVLNCQMLNPVQGVTNWEGSNWIIQKNEIKNLTTLKASGVDAAGGIGIFVGNMTATSKANNNKILGNKITGLVTIAKGAIPSVSGITLWADFSEHRPGLILSNTITNNTLSLTKVPAIKYLHGIGLNENRVIPVPAGQHVIKSNTVTGNIFPLPVSQMTRVECYPPDLKDVNTITVPRTLTMEDVALPSEEPTVDDLVRPF